jgi:hypothetical protein
MPDHAFAATDITPDSRIGDLLGRWPELEERHGGIER